MRFLSGLVLPILLPSAATAAQHDDKKTSLRGRSTTAAAELAAQQLFPISSYYTSDPLSDIARSGLDRSLSYIDMESEFNLPLSQEQLDALSGYVAQYSRDGNDDGTTTCPFDYEGDVDPRSRSLMGETTDNDGGHLHMHYVESSCNAMLHMATCVSWSEWNPDLTVEVKIPCGECVTLDASPGQALHGSTLNLGEGLNVVGKLVIPSDGSVDISAKYVFVQGQLVMPPPPSGGSTGISSVESGDRVKITLYGTDDIMFTPDNATDNAHLMGDDVSSKAFVVAGGKLDIRAIDPTCPSWVKLQSIQYGSPLTNVALGKTAIESSTYNNAGAGAMAAVDGNDNSFTHTQCHTGIVQWWEVDLADVYTIAELNIVNRQDCCGGRLHDFDIIFMDGNKTVVDTIHNAGGIGDRKTFSTDQVNARYVKIELPDKDCLQLGEVEVYGWLASEPVPIESLDVLTVGDDAARCWSAPGSRLLLTSDTYEWDDSHTATVAYVPTSPGPGKIYMMSLPKKKTAADETFGYPDFASEVALLDRSLVIEGAKDTGEFEKIGGHLIVLHTPHVHQHLEGALLLNMGQQGRLGRYPIHFHMSESVDGSTVAKNVIWESNQRCIVIHGSHNVTVSENVAYDTQGHCFMLEDGGEYDNRFEYNLGAKTAALPKDVIRPGETDHFPSTFWITNPSNHWKGNIAGGSQGPGFWFELKLREPSASLAINQGANPKTMSLGSFDDNTAHSNSFRAGITTYETGYRAPPSTTWNNVKSYKNKESGIFQHGTNNIIMKGGLLADNREAARNFHHEWGVYDGVTVIGRSQHVQSLIDEGRIPDTCKGGGISVQPNEGLGHGTTIKNSIFSGFDNECTGGKNYAIYVENDQVRNGVFDAAPTFTNNTFGSLDRPISSCISINNSPDGSVRNVAIEDDGSMSGAGPGFFVQDKTAITNFIDSASCHDAVEGTCLRFCPGACLRLGIVSISQDYTSRGFKMHITDGTKTGTVLRGDIWFDEKQNHLSAQVPLVVPEPSSGKYSITFTDSNDQVAWPGYASLSLEQEPACSGGLADASQVEFAMPPPGGRCEDLFHYDNYAEGIHGWQNFFSGMSISQEGNSWVISTTRRKDDRGHVNLSRTLDASCIAGLGGRTYNVSGKVRITDAAGNFVQTDGNSDASPKVSFIIEGVKTDSWNLATNGDGSWAEFSHDITLPVDSSAAWKARIIIDKSEKNEFHIADWAVVLAPSASPTVSPTNSPTSSPTSAPTDAPINPTTSPSKQPTTSPTTAPPVTSSPTGSPQKAATAAPVSTTPTNLALNGFALAETECYNGFAYKAIDGSASSINHSCCGRYGTWLMVDLGKDTVNHIDEIIIKNRANCCGGRLRNFYVEVLDALKNVVFTVHHPGNVGTGAIKTFTVNDGTAGRFVRLRYDDSIKDCLHVAELEVWGYPVELPANPPEITELALNRPATASSVLGSNPPGKSNDGNVQSFHHSQCNIAGGPWWQVDLGVESFVQDVVITNRGDCCGGRLSKAKVELLDSDGTVVQSREIVGSVGNGKVVQSVFNEDISVGRFVKVSMSHSNTCIHLAEVAVNGYHTMGMPTSSPTPTLTNVALGKTATESSTYNNAGAGAMAAVDGNDNSFTHTNCNQGIVQWWEVDLAGVYTIAELNIVNRQDCCGGRLHDFNIILMDGNRNVVDTIHNAGGIGSSKTFSTGLVNAQYVKIELPDMDCLTLGEVEVWAF